MVDSQNAPIKDADVVWVRPSNHVGIVAGKLDLDYSYAPDIRTTTDAKGDFELPRPMEPGRVLVLSTAGYASLNGTDFHGEQPLQLTAWSRVEGTCSSGGKPQTGMTIQLEMPTTTSDPTRGDQLTFEFSTTTDANGNFAFDHVPSLPLRLEAWANFGPAAYANILTSPGQTLHVNLGGDGSPVTEKIDLSAVIAVNPPAGGTSFDTSTSWIRAFRINPAPAMPAGADPSDWNSQMDAVLNGTLTENTPIPAYFADLHADGSFSFAALPPGKYELVAVIHGQRPPNTCGWGLVLARGQMLFTVAADSVDLPPLSPNVIVHPSVGSSAAEITGKDAAGNDFSLSSMRGKYVVLDFWAGWCGPCRASIPLLEQVYRKHASADVAFVGLNFDYTTAAAMSAIRDVVTPWPNVLLGPWDGNSPTLQKYDVSILPSLYVIDPSGHIAARDPSLEQLDALLPKGQ